MTVVHHARPIALSVATVAILVGCGSSHSAGAAAQSASVSSPAASRSADLRPTASASPASTCLAMLVAWQNGDGGHWLTQDSTTMGTAGADVGANELSQARIYAQQVWVPVTENLVLNPPPACADPGGYYAVYASNRVIAAEDLAASDLQGSLAALKTSNTAEVQFNAEVKQVEG